LARAFRPTILATAVAAAVLTVVAYTSPLEVAYMAPEGHIAIETAGSLISMLVAFIVMGRFLQSGRVSDLVLSAALLGLGISNLAFAVVPAALGSHLTPWMTWSRISVRLLGAVGFAFAALAPDSARIARARDAVARTIAVVAAAIAVIGLTFAFLIPDLSLGINPALSPRTSGHVVGHAGVLVVQLAAFFLYSCSAVGFALRAERTGDRLTRWLAVASIAGAIASINYFLYPSLYTQWIYTGDFFRVLFFLILLGGAASEIQHYQRSLADTAALEERRRLARELHDGLAQELAFIATQSRYMSRHERSGDGMEQLVVAAERALDESRSAISALTGPLDAPLDDALAQAAEDVAGRVGVRLRLQLERGIEVPASTREALVRIVREAVSNTARHGKASRVTVALSGGNGVRVRIADDGIGFDTADLAGRGFGLQSMSERARALGGELHVTSTPGSGTQIEVVV
jgi:signal transduction histidine kinase